MSKSMVVAVVALFFSLTGWGVAAKVALAPPNSVGTQQIVNGSVRLADMHPSAVKLLKGQKGDPGPQGLQGSQGLPGAAGLPGPVGRSADTFKLASDMRTLCRAVGDIQKTYPLGTLWLNDLRYSICFYSY